MSDFDEHVQMVKDCENRESKLTDTEREFIDAMSRRLDEGRALTPRMAEWLNAIWDRVT